MSQRPDISSSKPDLSINHERNQKRFHNEEMYAIHRVDTNRHRQNAWLVHLPRGGKTIQMTFSDVTYGGNYQTLEVAQACRDAGHCKLTALNATFVHEELVHAA